MFSNIDPDGVPREWRIEPRFAEFAHAFIGSAARPRLPGLASALHLLGLTKPRRTRYDEIMLGLHDAAKADLAWQAAAPGRSVVFPAGASWMAFTDQVPHAALSGRMALEQTFLVDPTALRDPSQGPLTVLEQLIGASLR